MAVAINSAAARGKVAARIIFFLPWLVSPIVAGVIWRWLFGESFGFVNFVIRELGADPLPWSTNADLSLAVVILASAWGGAAFNMLLFIAALNNVPQSYYEAAQLDGAGAWRRFWHITLPSIAPTSVLVILLSTLGHMKEFAMIQALNGGGPGTQNRLIVQYIYETGFKRSEIGYASAASMILLVILMVIAIIQMKISRRAGGDSDVHCHVDRRAEEAATRGRGAAPQADSADQRPVGAGHPDGLSAALVPAVLLQAGQRAVLLPALLPAA
nr:sugar ABC transporter permease [Tessaracoccus coleopterorum]